MMDLEFRANLLLLGFAFWSPSKWNMRSMSMEVLLESGFMVLGTKMVLSLAHGLEVVDAECFFLQRQSRMKKVSCPESRME